jgi:hypothetical protein
MGRLFYWGGWASHTTDQDLDSIELSSLGSMTPVDITHRFILEEGETIKEIALGNRHRGALTSHGNLFTWGQNQYNQLAQNEIYNEDSSMWVNEPTKVFYRTRTTVESVSTISYFFQERLPGSIIIFPHEELRNLGYQLDGWYLDEAFNERFDYERMPARDLALHGRYFINNDPN